MPSNTSAVAQEYLNRFDNLASDDYANEKSFTHCAYIEPVIIDYNHTALGLISVQSSTQELWTVSMRGTENAKLIDISIATQSICILGDEDSGYWAQLESSEIGAANFHVYIVDGAVVSVDSDGAGMSMPPLAPPNLDKTVIATPESVISEFKSQLNGFSADQRELKSLARWFSENNHNPLAVDCDSSLIKSSQRNVSVKATFFERSEVSNLAEISSDNRGTTLIRYDLIDHDNLPHHLSASSFSFSVDQLSGNVTGIQGKATDLVKEQIFAFHGQFEEKIIDHQASLNVKVTEAPEKKPFVFKPNKTALERGGR